MSAQTLHSENGLKKIWKMENITEKQQLVVRQPKKIQMLATITKEIFLKEFSVPAVQVTYRAVNSYPAVFNCNSPSLVDIEKAYGYDCLQAYLEGWIVNLREFVNVGKKMTDSQTFETAMIILQDYKFLTIADINLLFKRAKSGYYGNLYDRLDGQIILGWFRRYFSERCNAAEEESISEASKYKTDPYERTSEKIARDEHLFKLYKMKSWGNGLK